MAQVINTNIMSLNAQRNLNTNSASLASSIQRLSSGLRINSAKDDAAGLAISERFSTQIRGLTVAARNANDGISLAQTTEGALAEIGNNLQRIRELAVQSRNATNSDSDRIALDAEVQQLKAEIQRVAEQTQFNGTNLLDGSFTGAVFQVGANQGQTISVDKLVDANITKLGSWTAPPSTGKLAISDAIVINDAATAAGKISIEVNGTKVEIAAEENRTVAQAQKQLKAAFETAKKEHADDLGKVTLGDDFKLVSSEDMTIGAVEGATIAKTGEIAAVVPSVTTQDAIGIAKGKGAEKISMEINGVKIEVAEKAGRTDDDAKGALIAKFEELKKTESKLAKVSITDDGKITSTANLKIGKPSSNVTGLTKGELTIAASKPNATGFAAETVKTAEAADRMILAMDAALNAVNSGRAELGAIQNRFSSVVANLNSTSENLSASRSRIRDADYAQETAELTRTQILQQAGTAMLAQAKAIPQGVLSLLQ